MEAGVDPPEREIKCLWRGQVIEAERRSPCLNADQERDLIRCRRKKGKPCMSLEAWSAWKHGLHPCLPCHPQRGSRQGNGAAQEWLSGPGGRGLYCLEAHTKYISTYHHEVGSGSGLSHHCLLGQNQHAPHPSAHRLRSMAALGCLAKSHSPTSVPKACGMTSLSLP